MEPPPCRGCVNEKGPEAQRGLDQCARPRLLTARLSGSGRAAPPTVTTSSPREEGPAAAGRVGSSPWAPGTRGRQPCEPCLELGRRLAYFSGRSMPFPEPAPSPPSCWEHLRKEQEANLWPRGPPGSPSPPPWVGRGCMILFNSYAGSALHLARRRPRRAPGLAGPAGWGWGS